MMSARDYWPTDELWKDWQWRTRRAAVCVHPHKNWEEMRAASSMRVLINRRPDLAVPDIFARDAVEGRRRFIRTNEARS